VQSRKRNRNEVKPLSGLDVDALLGGKKKNAKISADNPIPEFRQILDKAEDLDVVRDAVKQLSNIIDEQIKNSFSDLAYGRALEEISVLRDEMIEFEEPGIYNEFLRALKSKLLSDELGGDRKEMWDLIRKNHLGLVEKKTSERSSVTEEEAEIVSIPITFSTFSHGHKLKRNAVSVGKVIRIACVVQQLFFCHTTTR